MGATTATFPIGRENAREKPISLVTPRQQDNSDIDHGEDMTKNEEAQLREATHALLLGVTTLVREREAERSAPKTNGNSQRNTIIAALFISLVPQVFAAVWWTRGTERDTAAKVLTLEKSYEVMAGEVSTLKVWNERVRLNLADKGWLVDPVSGTVKRKEK